MFDTHHLPLFSYQDGMIHVSEQHLPDGIR